MCGIAGIYHFNKESSVDVNELGILAETIKHRGPNNQGLFPFQNVGLAYRRLSIIDTHEQPQPILTNERQNLRIVFNGEIYNFRQLRDELMQKGHRFYTGTDTETILHLYEEEGVGCAARLNGIFAFAILDQNDGSLFIARDQLGVKPLYYLLQDDNLVFASELKAILALPWVKREVNRTAVDLYFKYRFVPDPITMFANIYKLKPGHWMKIDHEGINTQQYWSLSDEYRYHDSKTSSFMHNEGNVLNLVRSTFEESIKRQLISDVPLGAFLSGGIDSSIVVGTMAGMINSPVKTFSVGFGEQDYSEVEFARKVSEKFHTDHRELILTPDHVKSLPDIVYHLDEPLADPASVPTYFLSKMAKERVTVVLTGEGGDELFAGYKEDFGYDLGNVLFFLPESVRQILAEVWGGLAFGKGKTRIYRTLLGPKSRAEHVLRDLFRFESPPIVPYSSEYVDDMNREFSFTHYWRKAAGLNALNKLLYLETKIWLPGDPLMKVDKMSMAHGLEARVPLLDLEMVTLAAHIPAALKNKGGMTKYLLRQAFADILPEEITARPKTAFEIPVKEWLKNELAPMVGDYLSEDRLTKSAILDPKKVRQIIDLHQKGELDYKYEIWAMLNFQIWWEKWFS
jgi:asparagine synthase (glutamine-hydrolysing)